MMNARKEKGRGTSEREAKAPAAEFQSQPNRKESTRRNRRGYLREVAGRWIGQVGAAAWWEGEERTQGALEDPGGRPIAPRRRLGGRGAAARLEPPPSGLRQSRRGR